MAASVRLTATQVRGHGRGGRLGVVMLPRFNTSGPCFPGEHCMLPPEQRLGDVLALIEGRRFFTLQGAHRTGKTTSLMWLEEHLGATGRWRAVWVDLQAAREIPDVGLAMAAILGAIDDALTARHPTVPRAEPAERDAVLAVPELAILDYLRRLAGLDGRPLVLLLDEADGLVGEARGSFLTQLRREYGLGRGALDLMIEWREEQHAIEVKLRRDTETEQVEHRGRRVHVVGC